MHTNGVITRFEFEGLTQASVSVFLKNDSFPPQKEEMGRGGGIYPMLDPPYNWYMTSESYTNVSKPALRDSHPEDELSTINQEMYML